MEPKMDWPSSQDMFCGQYSKPVQSIPPAHPTVL